MVFLMGDQMVILKLILLVPLQQTFNFMVFSFFLCEWMIVFKKLNLSENDVQLCIM